MTDKSHLGSLEFDDFEDPFGVDVDSSTDQLFVATAGSNTVTYAETDDPTTAETVGGFGTDSSVEGVVFPMDVVVEDGGGLIVLDTGNGELDRYSVDTDGSYSYDGAFLDGDRDTFAGTALANPVALFRRGDRLYVLDAGNDRVVELDLETETATEPVSGPSWDHATGLAVDSDETIYVADSGAQVVFSYDDGDETSVSEYGSAEGDVKQPVGLHVDEDDRLYVADSGNYRVQVFEQDGTVVETFGSTGMVESIHGIATVDETVYVTDTSQQVVHVFGPSSAVDGPKLRIDQSTLAYGPLEVGYELEAGVKIHNDGTEPLEISTVTVDGSAYTAVDTELTVPAGAYDHLAIRFSPNETEYVTGQLSVETETGETGAVSLQGRGTEPTNVSAALVLDRSGSMLQDAGAESKMETLQRAADMFVELMRGEVGDSLTIVSFDDETETPLELTELKDEGPDTRADALDAIESITPSGLTSIGGGVETAHEQFPDDSDHRQVLVVVTDGMENRPPYVSPDEDSDEAGLELEAYEDYEIHTVGLGLGAEVDLGVLSTLAELSGGEDGGRGGTFHLTEEKWLRLQKFFLEIFGDAMGEYVALDPELDLVGTEPQSTVVELDEVDHTATIAVYWDDPSTNVSVDIEAPTGTILDAAHAATDPTIRHVSHDTYVFYRFPVPLGSAGDAHGGSWTVHVTADQDSAEETTVEVSAIVGSDLGIDCDFHRDFDGTGHPIALDARLHEAGVPVEPSSVSLEVQRPAYSRGELLASILRGDGETGRKTDRDHTQDSTNRSVTVRGHTIRNATDRIETDPTRARSRQVTDQIQGDREIDRRARLPTSFAGLRNRLSSILARIQDWLSDRFDSADDSGENDSPPADYATDETRAALAEAVANDERFRERTVERPDVEIVDDRGPAIRSTLDAPTKEGVYQYHYVVEYERNGRTLRRECRHSFAANAYPDRATTSVEVTDVTEDPETQTVALRVVPRDSEGNLIGPGLADEIALDVDHGSPTELTDHFDGSYSFTVTVGTGRAGQDQRIEDIDWIDPKTTKRLRGLGIDTVEDIEDADDETLRRLRKSNPELMRRLLAESPPDGEPTTVGVTLRGKTLRWPLAELLDGTTEFPREQSEPRPGGRGREL